MELLKRIGLKVGVFLVLYTVMWVLVLKPALDTLHLNISYWAVLVFVIVGGVLRGIDEYR